jgi:hypothetical protein
MRTRHGETHISALACHASVDPVAYLAQANEKAEVGPERVVVLLRLEGGVAQVVRHDMEVQVAA